MCSHAEHVLLSANYIYIVIIFITQIINDSVQQLVCAFHQECVKYHATHAIARVSGILLAIGMQYTGGVCVCVCVCACVCVCVCTCV